jgi:hypothetical protein
MPSSPDHTKKRRVGKACDSCRIKKTKCDGKKPCSRCTIDNKICVFTEKKKTRDKSHPQGYVELLETRLDILTKSLEKLIELSTPHLPFLNELGDISDSEDEEDDHDETDESECNLPNTVTSPVIGKDGELSENGSNVPINKVVHYLIKKQHLLSNLPVEWEQGAHIAANFNQKNLSASAKLFAQHKSTIKDNNEILERRGHHDHERTESKTDEHIGRSRSPNSANSFSNTTSHPPSNHSSHTNPHRSNLQSSLTEQMNLNDFSLGGYSSAGVILASSAPTQSISSSSTNDFNISDFESDSSHPPNPPYAVKTESISPPSTLLDNYPKRANSLFLNTGRNASVTSLTSKFENQGITSPSNSTPGTSQTSISLSTHRSRSPSFQKLKSAGHVHKPIHHHKHSKHEVPSKSNISNPPSLFPNEGILLQKPSVKYEGIDQELFDDPSQNFIQLPSQLDHSRYDLKLDDLNGELMFGNPAFGGITSPVDNETFETFMINNSPFLGAN